jgi:hypothetical protein
MFALVRPNRADKLSHVCVRLRVVPRKPIKAPIDKCLIRRSALNLVLKPEQLGAVLFLLVAIEIKIGRDSHSARKDVP